MYSKKDLQGFAKAAHSLKLYRRADLRDDVTDKSLIRKLYVDPLQNDAVLETMLRDSTTFLIGRKGTGKSTVFLRAQHELRATPNSASAYVDIKTVYEAADVDPTIPSQLAEAGLALREHDLKRVLLYRGFIRAVLADVTKELQQAVNSSIFDKIIDRSGLKRSDISGAIQDLLDGSFESQFTDVTAIRTAASKVDRETVKDRKATTELGLEIEASATGTSGNGKVKHTKENNSSIKNTSSEEYSDLVLSTFNIVGVIEGLQKILLSIGVKRIFIFIDDFSELPEEAMRVFVDTILSPLNNWSNEFIKFKVAAYPGRVYFGKIDPTKVDEIYLDLYKLYGEKDVSTMEEKATDFTRRLIESRFHHFLSKSFEEFCDEDTNAIYRQLFYASMANPRILGHLLANLRDSVTAYQRPIGIRAVQDAVTKYYEEKIEPFFGIQKFSHESFAERASVFSLKELLESIVSRARELREYKDSRVTRDLKGRTPSSHFYIVSSLESSLRTLELNFFVTLYYEMKDRDGNKVSVFALNYGLCHKYSIAFGRPSAQREHRLYFVERIFDDTSIVRKFLERNQEIKCDNCFETFGIDTLSSLAMYDMLCPKCKRGKCEVINLSKKYESVIRSVNPNLLLPATELGILETLYTEKREMVASEIAGELDCSYQLIGKRGRNLAEKGLVTREKNDVNRRIFSITEDAQEEYFDGNEERLLDV
ncbi:MAG: MarR family transcriptional regulator [Acetobacter sp.]|nr:MarR family transcriptional regulator [Acetobacter sp.]